MARKEWAEFQSKLPTYLLLFLLAVSTITTNAQNRKEIPSKLDKLVKKTVGQYNGDAVSSKITRQSISETQVICGRSFDTREWVDTYTKLPWDSLTHIGFKKTKFNSKIGNLTFSFYREIDSRTVHYGQDKEPTHEEIKFIHNLYYLEADLDELDELLGSLWEMGHIDLPSDDDEW